MKVSPIKLKDSKGYSLSLTIGRIYEVLGIEANKYRLLTDAESKPYGNEPVLYDPDCFEVVDPQEPDFWICQYGEDEERYCYPPEWSEVGFFEDYHNGISEARERFWNLLKSYYPKTWKERKGKANIGFQRTPDSALKPGVRCQMSKRAHLANIANKWITLWCTPVDWELFDRLHDEQFEDFSSAGRQPTKEGFAQGLAELVRAFPDLHTVVEELVIDESKSKVAVRWTAQGTNQTKFLGIGPTNQRTKITGIEIIEIQNSRIIRRWGEWDISAHE